MNNQHTRAPHWRDATHDGLLANAALLIDFDNVTMGIRSNLGQELRKLLDSDMIRGKVAVQRAYADWRRYPQYIVPLSEASIDLIFAPAYGSSRKNATDIRLAIDALELVFTRPEIGTFILLSGDSDFSSLVLKLKEYGKYVIGVGLQESSSDILVQNCDEYYSYNTLSGLTAAADMGHVKLDPWELAAKALDRMVERKDVMRSDRLKQVMLELDPSFDEKSAGFSKFNRFLAEAAHRGIVNLRKAPNGQYEVGAVAAKPGESGAAEYKPPSTDARGSGEKAATPTGTRDGRKAATPTGTEDGRKAPAWTGAPGAEALATAYAALAESVRELSKDRNDAVRDSEVKRKLLARDQGFDETALGFRKFSRFLQQARDEGIIDLEQRDDGNYYLRAVAEPTTRTGAAAAPAPEEARRRDSTTGRGRGGRGRGGRRGRRRDSDVAAEPAAREETEPAELAAETPPVEAEKVAPTAETSAPKSGSALSRGLGRFRRGSRGRTGPPKASDASPASGIGPIDAEIDAEEETRAKREDGMGESVGESVKEEGRDAGTAGASASARARGVGRFRSGSRGRAPSSATSAPSSATSTPSSAPSAPSEARAGENGSPDSDASGASAGLPADRVEIIGHMIRNYSGVGRRTAERLVEEFGPDVFAVIDAQPQRVKELLSKRQAQAVLDARDAERRR